MTYISCLVPDTRRWDEKLHVWLLLYEMHLLILLYTWRKMLNVLVLWKWFDATSKWDEENCTFYLFACYMKTHMLQGEDKRFNALFQLSRTWVYAACTSKCDGTLHAFLNFIWECSSFTRLCQCCLLWGFIFVHMTAGELAWDMLKAKEILKCEGK